jgi:hypothetical protein
MLGGGPKEYAPLVAGRFKESEKCRINLNHPLENLMSLPDIHKISKIFEDLTPTRPKLFLEEYMKWKWRVVNRMYSANE